MRKKPYTKKFFSEKLNSMSSARRIVPFLIEAARPKSVIDLGCGTADFLSVFIKNNIPDVLGVDGEWVEASLLKIPKESFMPAELEKPFRLDRKFDLVLSLEVAEHIPEKFAGDFIDTLTGLGDMVCFSAAVPSQGGRSHLNERWPDYWAGLFSQRGYASVDCLRKRFWNDPEVNFWYAQNMIFYIREEKLSQNPFLEKEHKISPGPPLPLIHPGLYLKKCGKKRFF